MRAVVSHCAGFAALLVCASDLSSARAADPPPDRDQDATPRPTTVTSAGAHYERGGSTASCSGTTTAICGRCHSAPRSSTWSATPAASPPSERWALGRAPGSRCSGADGRAYTFRGIEKDAVRRPLAGPPRTIAGRIAQDQIAALHPGERSPRPRCSTPRACSTSSRASWSMPDDARLGKFRRDFAGALGTIEEYPQPAHDGQPGFAGATEIIGSKEFLGSAARARPTNASTRAPTCARGSWTCSSATGTGTRSSGAGRSCLARPGGSRSPRTAISPSRRFEGMVLVFARNWYPRWVTFGDDYPDMLGITWQAWPLDRAVLTDLEKRAWDEIAADVRARLTDEVIDSAVRRLPQEYQRADGARLANALRHRRDRLGLAADRFYRHLSEEVRIERHRSRRPGGGGRVRGRRPRREGVPHRRLRRGRGRAVVPPTLPRPRDARDPPRPARRRRLGSPLADDPASTCASSAARATTCSTTPPAAAPASPTGRGTTASCAGAGRGLTRGRIPLPLRSPETPCIPARDWGRQTTYVPWFGASPDIGAFLGARGAARALRVPHPSRTGPSISCAPGTRPAPARFRADYAAISACENSRVFLTLTARASQLQILHFYGFGNETPRPPATSSTEVRQTQLSLVAAGQRPARVPTHAVARPRRKRSSTRRTAGRLVTEARPYGSSRSGSSAPSPRSASTRATWPPPRRAACRSSPGARSTPRSGT